VLWQQSGYFDGAATLKPLLHTWSLALEEQYYFVLPLLLWLTGRRARGPVLIGLTLASAACGLWMLGADPSGAFYLLPSRAWELLIGSMCALPGLATRLKPRWDAGWVCLPVMALCLVWGVDAAHPRLDALLVCLATAGLIVMPSVALQSTRPWMRPLHWIGDQSYSLYLVHWPLIALAKSIWLEGVPMAVSLALLAASVAIAQLSYKFVEQRFRHIDSPRVLLRQMMVLLIPLALASGWMWHRLHPTTAQTDWAHTLRPNYGFSPNCDQETDFTPKPACASSAHPRTLIWGDSYAMHLVPGFLASAPPGGILQATRSACAPILTMARQVPSDPSDRAESCMAFNQSVLDYLQHAHHIEYVVLSARWPYFFEDAIANDEGLPAHPDAAMLSKAVRDTIEQLRRMHKKVIVVAPPPSLGQSVNLGLCAERRALGLPVLMSAAHNDCSFSLSLSERRQHDTVAMLKMLAREAKVHVIRPGDVTCADDRCKALDGAVPLYRDAGHLSVNGSRLLGRRLDLNQQLSRYAH